jgi:hypothetical protein
MAKSYCEAHRLPCLHEPQCISDCYLDAGKPAYLAPQPDPSAVIRKIKPYPTIPDDIEPAPDSWHTVGALMFGAILAVLVVFFTLIFFTIMYLWSLLI